MIKESNIDRRFLTAKYAKYAKISMTDLAEFQLADER